jgi:hypothetical protein
MAPGIFPKDRRRSQRLQTVRRGRGQPLSGTKEPWMAPFAPGRPHVKTLEVLADRLGVPANEIDSYCRCYGSRVFSTSH